MNQLLFTRLEYNHLSARIGLAPRGQAQDSLKISLSILRSKLNEGQFTAGLLVKLSMKEAVEGTGN